MTTLELTPYQKSRLDTNLTTLYHIQRNLEELGAETGDERMERAAALVGRAREGLE